MDDTNQENTKATEEERAAADAQAEAAREIEQKLAEKGKGDEQAKSTFTQPEAPVEEEHSGLVEEVVEEQEMPAVHGTQKAANLGLQSDASGSFTTNQ